jgi:hypothetical protein
VILLGGRSLNSPALFGKAWTKSIPSGETSSNHLVRKGRNLPESLKSEPTNIRRDDLVLLLHIWNSRCPVSF